jgi:16S rRNA (adenine1518-N6/adenine1519-N6)-dimethyltransferase
VTSAAERLRARGLRPKKRLGQNFLQDPAICRAIAEAATPVVGGSALEIGPGLGALTAPLLARCGRVVAIERDGDLVPLLEESFAAELAAGTLTLRHADALEVDWQAELAAMPAPRALAGNLPYFITGALLEEATACAELVDVAVFMIQAEVAARLLAAPGTDAYGALTVFVQAAFGVAKLTTVRGGAFFPRPDVDSTVVVLTPSRPRRAVETEAFRAAVRAAFGMRRKTLRNAWRGLYGWSPAELADAAVRAGVSLDARGETLAVEDFARLAALAPA